MEVSNSWKELNLMNKRNDKAIRYLKFKAKLEIETADFFYYHLTFDIWNIVYDYENILKPSRTTFALSKDIWTIIEFMDLFKRLALTFNCLSQIWEYNLSVTLLEILESQDIFEIPIRGRQLKNFAKNLKIIRRQDFRLIELKYCKHEKTETKYPEL